MKKDYTGYTAEQLLNDEYFVSSEQHPTDESNRFWETRENEDPNLKEEIRIARILIQRIKSNFHEQTLLSPDKVHGLWARIQKQNLKNQKRKVIQQWIIYTTSAAAIFCLFFFQPFTFNTDIDYQAVIAALPEIDSTKNVQLIFSNEEKISIQKKESQVSYDKQGNIRIDSECIRKVSTDRKKATEQLNKLIVPAGKRSTLLLSDGTKLWANSSTTIIYPQVFSDDKREIYIDGEAYLEVAHDATKPFHVKTQQMEVQVLGTSFNVCAYHEDNQQQVVLVNGKVEIHTQEGKNTILSPNDMLEYDKQGGRINVSEVDALKYITWKNGYYHFVSQPLSNILKRLSRYYDVPIVYDNQVGHLLCSGKLDLSEQMDRVLENLKNATPITIEHDHGKIIVSQKH